MPATPQHPDTMDQLASDDTPTVQPVLATLPSETATDATGPAAPDERADQIAFLGPPATAGPITQALTKGVCRKRSFKRQAPPPPSAPSATSAVASVATLSTSSDEAMSSGTDTGGGGPPTPRRSKASRQAMMKLQGLTSAGPPTADTRLATPVPSELSDYEYVGYYGSPEVNYYPYTVFPGSSPPFSPPPLAPGSQAPIFGGESSYPPPWGRGGGVPAGGLIHSASEGSVVPYQRRPGPLVPLPEETTAADGVLVASHHATSTPVYTRAVSPTLSQASQAYFNNDRRRRLDRSDSVVTVAHLCEDLYVVSPRFRVTLTNMTVMVVVAAIALPNTAALLFTFFRLVFGTLFPAYYSYKAVKTKNVKEYVKWMMYWIVFAFFTCFETITDLFMAFWFPFYYELKIMLVLWLLSPATRGSSVLYRKFVHPWLTQREDEIDECIARAKVEGYSTVLQIGTRGVNYATSVIMQTAIKGGGGLVNQLKRSYSVGELAEDQLDVGSGGDHNSNINTHPPGHDIGNYRHHPPTHAGRGEAL